MEIVYTKLGLTIECFRYDSFLSNMYLVYCPESLFRGEAIIVDPHISERLEKKLAALEIENIIILLTHEHFDHTTGVNWLSEHYKCELICQKLCGERIALLRNNRPLSIMSSTSDAQNYLRFEPYKCFADRIFDQNMEMQWHKLLIKFTHTPGHSKGSCCIQIEDCLFVGDSLIKDHPVITRFPGGSMDELTNITIPFLDGISEDITILPGHFDAFKKAEVYFSKYCFI